MPSAQSPPQEPSPALPKTRVTSAPPPPVRAFTRSVEDGPRRHIPSSPSPVDLRPAPDHCLIAHCKDIRRMRVDARHEVNTIYTIRRLVSFTPCPFNHLNRFKRIQDRAKRKCLVSFDRDLKKKYKEREDCLLLLSLLPTKDVHVMKFLYQGTIAAYFYPSTRKRPLCRV